MSEGEDQQRLGQYLARIGLAGAPPLSAAGLEQVQFAHRRAITFENLDIMLRRGIAIDADSIFAKLVSAGRGGYCFEQNTLFAAMLDAMGFKNRLLMARVLLGDPPLMPPLTHCLVLTQIEGRYWIADAGFGGSYVPPLPLEDGAEAIAPDGARHRLRRIGAAGSVPGEWLLERMGPAAATDGRGGGAGWQKQYAFNLAEVAQADLELGNHWTSTHPEARFTNLHVVSIALPDGFAALTDREFATYAGGRAESRTIESAGEYRAVLREIFNLELDEEEVAALPLFA